MVETCILLTIFSVAFKFASHSTIMRTLRLTKQNKIISNICLYLSALLGIIALI